MPSFIQNILDKIQPITQSFVAFMMSKVDLQFISVPIWFFFALLGGFIFLAIIIAIVAKVPNSKKKVTDKISISLDTEQSVIREITSSLNLAAPLSDIDLPETIKIGALPSPQSSDMDINNYYVVNMPKKDKLKSIPTITLPLAAEFANASEVSDLAVEAVDFCKEYIHTDKEYERNAIDDEAFASNLIIGHAPAENLDKVISTKPTTQSKNILNAINQMLINKAIEEAEAEQVKDTVAEPVVKDAVIEPVVEDTVIEPVVEDTVAEPVIEDAVVEPVVEDAVVEPVVEDAIVEPVVEDAVVEPVVEDTVVEPVIEDTVVEPVIEDAVVEPVVEDAVVEPVVEDTVAEPVVEEAVVKPVVEEAVVKPVVEEEKLSLADMEEQNRAANNFFIPRPVKESSSSFTAPIFVQATQQEDCEQPRKIIAKAGAASGITKKVINYKLLEPVITHPENIKIIPLTTAPMDKKRGSFRVIFDAYSSEKPYRYQLLTKSGQILFQSEGYKIKPRAKQVETFQKTITTGTFLYEKEQNGSYRFKLIGSNGKLCGLGDMYATLDDAEKSALATKKYGLAANYIEDISDS